MKGFLLAIALLLFSASFADLQAQNSDKSHKLDSVVVSASVKRELKPTQISAISVPASTIYAMPATLGETDVLKFFQMQPGVQRCGDGNVSLFIRGGASSQNLFLIDGVTLYNPEHFKGYVSAINPIAVSDVLFYKGGFPSKYSNRLSGIIDISTKRGDFNQYHGSVNVGMFSTSAMVGGPIIKDKLSFAVSARLSYYKEVTSAIMDWLYDKADESDDGTKYNFPFEKVSFYDFNAKISYKPNRHNIIDFTLYSGKDNNVLSNLVQISREINTQTKLPEEFIRTEKSSEKWGNILLGINWNYSTESADVYSNLSYSAYFYDEQYHFAKIYNQYDDSGSELTLWNKTTDFSQYKSDVNKIQLSNITKFKKGFFNGLEIGFDIGYSLYNPYYSAYNHKEYSYMQEEKISSLKAGERNITTGGIFAAYNFNFGKVLQMDIGFRATLHAVKDKSYLYPEPRANIAVNITDKFSLKAAYSIISQSEHKISTADLLEDSDIWLPSGKTIKPAVSSQIAAGVFYDFKGKRGFKISLEGYYKDMKDIIEYKEGALSAFNAKDWEESVAVGAGWAYGAELLLSKYKGSTTGWISYTWSKSLEKFDREGQMINGGKTFYAPHDSRNNITLNITQHISKNFDLSATFSYYTGRYRTISNIEYKILYLTQYYPSYDTPNIPLHPNWSWYAINSASQRNNIKLDDYHKLDLSLSYYIFHRTGKSTVTVGVTNLYNNYNISFLRGGIPLIKVCMFPIMPSLSYSYSF